QPCPQQGRRLFLYRENTPRATDECIDTEICSPLPYSLCVHLLQPGGYRFARIITLQKRLCRFTVGKIKSAHAGAQKFATWCRHSVKNLNLMTGFSQQLGSHKACRSCTY